MFARKYFGFVFLFIFYSFFVSTGLCKDISSIPKLEQGDRVLVLVPHPDDEAIGTAGILQRALRSGSAIKVVFYTNGDANELSFILYEKMIPLFSGAILHMGEVRRKESLAALKFLGLDADKVIFLGYPDFGTMAILTRYWGKVKPYTSLFTRVSRVSYPEALSFHAPYVGESILNDIKKILLDFKPTKIFVSHPVDTNGDHRSLHVFLRVALWDLEEKIGKPQVFPYLIHVTGWPRTRGYHLEQTLDPPDKYTAIQWQQLLLTQEEIQKKHDAISLYKSQLEFEPSYLFSFDRPNELFGDYPFLALKRQTGPEMLWQDIGIDMDKLGDNATPEAKESAVSSNSISYIAFARHEDNLWVKFILNKKIDKTFGISLYLLGFSKKRDFSSMPKIRITLGTFGVKIRDKNKKFVVEGFQMAYRNRSIVLKIPLKSLGEPDHIFTSSHVAGFPYEATAWRILELQ